MFGKENEGNKQKERKSARTCPDCQGGMYRIDILDKGEKGGVADLEFNLPGDKSFFGSPKRSGVIVAFMCEKCGRVVLYGASY